MKYVINIENPTPDVLRQIWYSVARPGEDRSDPTSSDAGDMKIFIQIEDGDADLVAGLGKIIKATQMSQQPLKRTTKWSRKAKINLNKKSPTAPHGLKKDGTPRQKAGRKPLKIRLPRQLPLKG